MTLDLCMTGELAAPHSESGSKNHPAFCRPRSFFHRSFPSMEYAKRPSEPKYATTTLPSVTGVGDAWEDLGWRLVWGVPWCAVCSHRIFPVFLSKASTFHWCGELSITGSVSPNSPTLSDCLGSLEIAVVTKTRSPHTTGEETESPGISVFQTTLVALVASQCTGGLAPSPTPEAEGPRNCGQSPAIATPAASSTAPISFMASPLSCTGRSTRSPSM